MLFYITYGASIWDKNQGNSEISLEVGSFIQVLLVPFCTLQIKKFVVYRVKFKCQKKKICPFANRFHVCKRSAAEAEAIATHHASFP